MPVLHITPPQSNVKQFELPSTTKLPQEERAWVLMDVGPDRPADWLAVTDLDRNYAARQARVVVSRIQKWNFIDDQGSPIPVSFENFWHLAPEDRLYLLTIKFDEPAGQTLTTQEKKT